MLEIAAINAEEADEKAAEIIGVNRGRSGGAAAELSHLRRREALHDGSRRGAHRGRAVDCAAAQHHETVDAIGVVHRRHDLALQRIRHARELALRRDAAAELNALRRRHTTHALHRAHAANRDVAPRAAAQQYAACGGDTPQRCVRRTLRWLLRRCPDAERWRERVEVHDTAHARQLFGARRGLTDDDAASAGIHDAAAELHRGGDGEVTRRGGEAVDRGADDALVHACRGAAELDDGDASRRERARIAPRDALVEPLRGAALGELEATRNARCAGVIRRRGARRHAQGGRHAVRRAGVARRGRLRRRARAELRDERAAALAIFVRAEPAAARLLGAQRGGATRRARAELGAHLGALLVRRGEEALRGGVGARRGAERARHVGGHVAVPATVEALDTVGDGNAIFLRAGVGAEVRHCRRVEPAPRSAALQLPEPRGALDGDERGLERRVSGRAAEAHRGGLAKFLDPNVALKGFDALGRGVDAIWVDDAAA